MIIIAIGLGLIFGIGIVAHIIYSKSPVKEHSYEKKKSDC